MKSGHEDRRGQTKISYGTLAKAQDAARRRTADFGGYFRAYRCRRGDRAEHYHVCSWEKPRSAGQQAQEAWRVELGRRVAGCLWVENGPDHRLRYDGIRQRWRGVWKRVGLPHHTLTR